MYKYKFHITLIEGLSNLSFFLGFEYRHQVKQNDFCLRKQKICSFLLRTFFRSGGSALKIPKSKKCSVGERAELNGYLVNLNSILVSQRSPYVSQFQDGPVRGCRLT